MMIVIPESHRPGPLSQLSLTDSSSFNTPYLASGTFQPNIQLIGPGIIAHEGFDQLQEHVSLCGSWQTFNHPVEAVR